MALRKNESSKVLKQLVQPPINQIETNERKTNWKKPREITKVRIISLLGENNKTETKLQTWIDESTLSQRMGLSFPKWRSFRNEKSCDN